MKKTLSAAINAMLGMALVGALTGCAGGFNDRSSVIRPTKAPPAHVQNGAGVLQGDYVFYPAYQTYHSRNRSDFVYLEGDAWISRPTPSGVSPEALFASPSVSLGTRDAPSF